MISYDPFFKTMKRKGISTYQLIHQHGISSSLLNRLRKNLPITTVTINDLCENLQCQVEDIIIYRKVNDEELEQ